MNKKDEFLSPTAKGVLKDALVALMIYEAANGPLPLWVAHDIPVERLLPLLMAANRLRMPLAERDLVVGEYL